MSFQPLTLAIADDHTLFRKGLLEIIKLYPEITVVADAGNGAELIEEIELKLLPNIVLLDLEMPEMDGIATARYILSKYPEVKILIVSMYGELPLVDKLVREGVHGYLLKSAEPEELREALQLLVMGKNYFSPLIGNASFF
ncbi:response regulator transcription factor [Pontibacter sp. KCTC 32443]|uniref:response regulator n=1 Tax=Pontibacter TaxID=323449 RepID=UPI00164E9AE3|nr:MULTISPECIES: response regulator transcription factor [Pontibacter]MBC5774671.1 response regulator transcription factor [Pontibacter sp. KCTC 32443]